VDVLGSGAAPYALNKLRQVRFFQLFKPRCLSYPG
jgi:hypothetical protein